MLNAPGGKAITDSEISIAEILDIASEIFPDVLPEDVLSHFGYKTRPDGVIGKSARFSRDLDTDGNKLSAQQAEFFKDSKVRDSKGRLT